MNKGLNFAFEQLKGSAETLAISIGQQLAPDIDRLIGIVTNLTNKLIEGVKWSSELPTPIKAGAAALVAFAAAIGPILFGLGQMMQIIASLAPILGALQQAFGLSNLPCLDGRARSLC